MCNHYRMILLGMIVTQGASLIASEVPAKGLSNSGKVVLHDKQQTPSSNLKEKKVVPVIIDWYKKEYDNKHVCRFKRLSCHS